MDNSFYDRADALIDLANSQIGEEAKNGMVSASFLYAASRFNAWLSATGFENSEEMQKAKQETIDYFTNEYRKMLDENLTDYIENFHNYMQIKNN